MEFSALTNPLPSNVQILSFEIQNYDGKNMNALVRLQNIYAASESSQNATVDLSNTFSNLTPTGDITEMGLTGTVPLSDIKFYSWNTTSGQHAAKQHQPLNTDNKYQITLTPLQIRTFLMGFVPNN